MKSWAFLLTALLLMLSATGEAVAADACYDFTGTVNGLAQYATSGVPTTLPFQFGPPFISDGLATLQVGQTFSGRYVYSTSAPQVALRTTGQTFLTTLGQGGQITVSFGPLASASSSSGPLTKYTSPPYQSGLQFGVFSDTSLSTATAHFHSARSIVEFSPPPRGNGNPNSPPFVQWQAYLSFSGVPPIPPSVIPGVDTSTTGGLLLYSYDHAFQTVRKFTFYEIHGQISSIRTCAPELIDPVSLSDGLGMLNGTRITNNISTLTSPAGRAVKGVSADGVTQILVRTAVPDVDHDYTVNIRDEQGNTGNVSDYGGIARIDGPTDAVTGLPTVLASTTIRSVATPGGPKLLFVYKAPSDFPTSQSSYTGTKERSVSLRVLDGSNQITDGTITIVRPPTVFIHGIWSDPAYAWGESGFYPEPLPQFPITAFYSSYKQPVAITGNLPDYDHPSTAVCPYEFQVACDLYGPQFGAMVRSNIQSNSLGFSFNAKMHVLPWIQRPVMDQFRAGGNISGIPVAAVQADIVAHSMGGLVTRALGLLPEFYSDDTFGRGTVHKVITISTPHLGSPLALQFHNPQNDCARYWLSLIGIYVIQSATTVGFSSQVGGSWSLRGDPTTGLLSNELKQLKTARIGFPTAYVYGEMSSGQLQSIDPLTTWAAALRNACPGSPMADNFTSQLFPSMMGGPSDAVVPTISSANGQGNADALMAVHSKGMVQLGFGGPYVTEAASGVADKVMFLLGIPLTTPSVYLDPRQ